MNANKLMVNPDKTHLIGIGSKKQVNKRNVEKMAKGEKRGLIKILKIGKRAKVKEKK